MYKFRDENLTFEERAADLISLLTLPEKASLMSSHMAAIPRLGIGEWYVGAEVARGYVSRNPEEPTTVFPEPVGLAGTFDTELMSQIGEVAGTEARILNKRHPNGHLMLWGPTVDMCRNPLWGRNEEGYGEDPYLTGEMSAAYTLALAGKKGEYYKTIPTLKHFCANNTEHNRGTASSNINPRTLNEYYYAAFEPAIRKGGAYSIMAAYNELSGMPALVNPDIKNILKDKWGLGFAVTDGGDFTQNALFHRYDSSHAKTLALAVKCGVDVMTDNKDVVKASAIEAVKSGYLTEEELDKALLNSLLARFKLGEFDKINPYSDIDETLMDCDEHKAVNLRAACEQMTLLKNDGILPLDKTKSVAVIGLNGNCNLMDWYTGYSSYNIPIRQGLESAFADVRYDNGCDIIVIKSKLTGKYLGVDDDGNVSAVYERTDRRALFEKSEYGHGEVTYRSLYNNKYITEASYKADSESTMRWFSQEIMKPREIQDGIMYKTYFGSALSCDDKGKLCPARAYGITDAKLFYEELISSGTQRAAALAEKCDVAIVCTGNDPMIVAREMYDRKTLSLPCHEKELIKSVYGVNKNTVLTVVSGYPFNLCDEQEYVPAIIYTSHAGPELGRAFAKTVTGELNPAGRLCQTWYKNEYELAPIESYDIIEDEMTYLYYKGEPLYPFGYGLSYSAFEYSDFEVKQENEKILASLNVKNISGPDGDEVVQIYFRFNSDRIKRPLKQLCAFERRRIAAGMTDRFTFEIDKNTLRFFDVISEQFKVEDGCYEFYAASSSADIRQTKTVNIKGETIPPRNLKDGVKAINYDMQFGSEMQYSKSLCRHYMKGGALLYNNCVLNGAKRLCVICSSEAQSGDISVSLCGKEICKITVPPTVNLERFVTLQKELDLSDTGDSSGPLQLSMPGQIRLISFKAI